jgi:hypothetical protein
VAPAVKTSGLSVSAKEYTFNTLILIRYLLQRRQFVFPGTENSSYRFVHPGTDNRKSLDLTQMLPYNFISG